VLERSPWATAFVPAASAVVEHAVREVAAHAYGDDASLDPDLVPVLEPAPAEPEPAEPEPVGPAPGPAPESVLALEGVIVVLINGVRLH